MNPPDIVLASGSPRRSALLRTLGWEFRTLVPDVDETPLQDESPASLCLRLATAKAEAARQQPGTDQGALIVAADTIVVQDGTVLGKPRSPEENAEMLRRLQGRAHEVLTGIGLLWKDRSLSGVERTAVHIRPLDEEEIRLYVRTGEGMDKAGGYAIQGRGALFVASIEGDYSNVVGLPLCRLGLMVREILQA